MLAKTAPRPRNFGSLLGHRSQKGPKHHTKIQQVLHLITPCFHNFQQVITYHETKTSHLITRRSWGVDKTTDAIQQSVNKNCVRVATNSSLSRRFNHKSAETRTGQGFCNVPPVRVFCFGLPNECFDGLICSFQKKRRTARTSDPPLRLRVILCASVRSITTNN